MKGPIHLRFQTIQSDKEDRGMSDLVVCTATCADYLHMAKALAKSVKQHHPDARFAICIVEKELHPEVRDCGLFDHIVLAKDLGYSHFQKHIFRHFAYEGAISVRAKFIKYVMSVYHQAAHFAFLDPDILIYSPLLELQDALNRHSIVLTPHICEPESYGDIWEKGSLRHGIFNLGFLGLSRTTETFKMLDWWEARLASYCYKELDHGIFVDQKWMDLAPCFFNVHTLKHPGYNVALWNFPQRTIEKDENGHFRVNGLPLRFFHYSNRKTGHLHTMKKIYAKDQRPIDELVHGYETEIKAMGEDRFESIRWSYDFFDSGKKILKMCRRNYRNYPDLYYDRYDNPFAKANIHFSDARVRQLLGK